MSTHFEKSDVLEPKTPRDENLHRVIHQQSVVTA
jgi:hypothetical protein